MKTFRALTTTVSVEIDASLPLADIAHAIIASFPPADDTPALAYELTPAGFQRDGTFVGVGDPTDVVPTFELDFYEQVGTHSDPGWLLHAAALEVGGRALVLCGPSGAGKTTLTLALAARGFRLLTEEMVWIDAESNVRGLPRALHVPAKSALDARIPAGWTRLPYPTCDRAGVVQDNLLVVPPREAFVLDARPLATIVRIGHGPDWDVHLVESDRTTALERLWTGTFRKDAKSLEVATEVLRSRPSYVLSSRSEREALQLLETLLK